MNHLEELKTALERIEFVHEGLYARLKKVQPDVDPYSILDTDGRYILLDSLTAIVSAKTVLASAEINSRRKFGTEQF